MSAVLSKNCTVIVQFCLKSAPCECIFLELSLREKSVKNQFHNLRKSNYLILNDF